MVIGLGWAMIGICGGAMVGYVAGVWATTVSMVDERVYRWGVPDGVRAARERPPRGDSDDPEG